ncbi:MAG: histidine kinase [Proteobacteria bacterium]|nr:histidine kinase [Pseudomonadota bacterium]
MRPGDAPAEPESPGAGSATPWPTLEAVLQRPLAQPRWMGWRLRAMVAVVVAGLAGVLLVAHWLAAQPKFPLRLQATPQGEVRLGPADYPTLTRLEGLTLQSLELSTLDRDGTLHTQVAPMGSVLLQPSGRWIIDQQAREAFALQHQRMGELMQHWSPIGLVVQLHLHHAADEMVLVAPRGWSGRSPMFWLLSGLALLVLTVGSAVVLVGPHWGNAGFAVLALSQCAQLMLIGVEHNLEVFTPPWLVALDVRLRLACDLASAAALVHMALLQPQRRAGWQRATAPLWLAAAGLWLLCSGLNSPLQWWLAQLSCAGLALLAVGLASQAQRQAPHPLTLVMRRLLLISILTWTTLTLALWLGARRADLSLQVATYGVATWEVFVTSLVLITPYLSRSRSVLQEFSLLAASGTIAACLDLLFVALFSLGQFTSMTLSLFLSLGLYLSARRWLLSRLPRPDEVTMEQVFQQMFRIARQVERQPELMHEALVRLLRDLFDPLEIQVACGQVPEAMLRGNGAVMLVPVPCRANAHGQTTLVLKHARKGQSLFTTEDARLAHRIMEQLHRALTFDEAVEQGRSEERLRIAQDLHDDIGARLLTLMYQAPTPEMEDYIRHTIQDLKTLTRGLAAQSHMLSAAAAEWKRDLSHRLTVARCELAWRLSADTDVQLNMVQWSALTRVLRELVSNAISHAQARRIEVCLTLEQDCLTLSVSDDGLGSDPAAWAHGLGLGGVRKRVKQLGGTVRWLQQQPQGIRCEVTVPHFAGAGSGHAGSGAAPSTFGVDSHPPSSSPAQVSAQVSAPLSAHVPDQASH